LFVACLVQEINIKQELGVFLLVVMHFDIHEVKVFLENAHKNGTADNSAGCHQSEAREKPPVTVEWRDSQGRVFPLQIN
jgi:hypothetical protein